LPLSHYATLVLRAQAHVAKIYTHTGTHMIKGIAVAIALVLAVAGMATVLQPSQPKQACRHALIVFGRAYPLISDDAAMASCLHGYELYRRTHTPESCQRHLACVMAGETPDEIMICDKIP
jgi:hypothetical protein